MDINTVWKVPRIDDEDVDLQSAMDQVSKQRDRILDYQRIHETFPLADLPFWNAYEEAALKIAEAIRINRPIFVWGDFDVDGATSTACMVYGLSKIHATVTYGQAARLGKGHGMDVDTISKIAPAKALIITVDNGSSDHEAHKALKKLGFDIIVTDHHLVEGTPTVMVVNPKLYCTENDDEYMAPGVWVAARLVIKVAVKVLGVTVETLEHIVEFCNVMVGLGILSDIIPLNKLFFRQLQCSLAAMRLFQHPGWEALLDICYTSPNQPITSRYLSYVVIPKLNSAGRMNQADIAVRLLLMTDYTEANMASARVLASTLKSLNDERKAIEQDIYDQVIDMLFKNKELPAGIVLYEPTWHAGVLGVVCSRITEETGRPICLLCKDQYGTIKGSGRGGEIVDLYAALQGCSDILAGFGGHRAAAGMSVANEQQLKAFQKQFAAEAAKQMEGYTMEIHVDAVVTVGICNNVTFQTFLENFQPIGKDNPAIHLLLRKLRVIDIKEKRNILMIYCVEEETGLPITLTKFRATINTYDCTPDRIIDAIVTPVFNYYTGIVLIEWEIKDLRTWPQVTYTEEYTSHAH